MDFNEWPPLHDAVVDSLCVRWPGGIATISMETSTEKLEIVATGLKLLSCPQDYPWGTAKYLYVNDVRLTETGHERVRLELETQGGDLIVLEAADITLRLQRPSQRRQQT